MLLVTTSEDQHSCSLWILEGHCTAPVFRCLGAPAMAPVQLAPKDLKHELRFSMKHQWTQHERDEWQNNRSRSWHVASFAVSQATDCHLCHVNPCDVVASGTSSVLGLRLSKQEPGAPAAPACQALEVTGC